MRCLVGEVVVDVIASLVEVNQANISLVDMTYDMYVQKPWLIRLTDLYVHVKNHYMCGKTMVNKVDKMY